MLRRLHSLPGLILALAIAVVAATGVVLSVQPTLDRFGGPVVERGTSVAALAGAVAARHQSVESIRVRANGVVTAAYTDGDTGGVERIDPATGAGLGPFVVSEFTRTVTDLHRAFLAGDGGRIAAAVGAGGMLVLTLSGVLLLARRLGGAKALFRPVRGGSTLERLHGEFGRLAAIGLIVSAGTGLWMSASTFGLLPDDGGDPAPIAARGLAPAPVGGLRALAAADVGDLRELRFPDPADRADTFLMTTTEGRTLVDPGTGAALAFEPATVAERIGEVVRTLHTGRGAWALGLLLGLSSAAVPFFAVSGVVMWARRRSRRAAVPAMVPVARADTVILVGSDGGSTRGFAATLATALTAHGHRVHVADMNAVSAAHLRAERLLVLAATWGDGGAPASAARFLDRLARLEGRPAVAVLGFGDRTFPHFCGYAHAVSEAFEAAGFPRLLETKRIDRRSAQEFAQWGRELGAVLGHELVLEHVAERPETTSLELVYRDDYGSAVGAPVAILRFAVPQSRPGARRGRLPDFEAGDLLGVVPPGDAMPRFYSLASSASDGIVEICVRLMPGGVCSSRLHALRTGDRIEAFVRTNPSFRPAETASSLILIGAGAGIGPLAGFVRANDGARPVHLYWGGRNPASDFLYEHELAAHLAENRLTSLTTAFSRDPQAGAYVQDRIAADAPRLRELVRAGAQILVCCSRDMGTAVSRTLDGILHPIGVDLASLKARGRYVEDVY
ncbi:MAG: nitric oxide synthase [Phyllobacteriaceae bacterium]|nr:nitric oxide synthase [Phyllobacteriaceae bacterium]